MEKRGVVEYTYNPSTCVAEARGSWRVWDLPCLCPSHDGSALNPFTSVVSGCGLRPQMN